MSARVARASAGTAWLVARTGVAACPSGRSGPCRGPPPCRRSRPAACAGSAGPWRSLAAAERRSAPARPEPSSWRCGCRCRVNDPLACWWRLSQRPAVARSRPGRRRADGHQRLHGEAGRVDRRGRRRRRRRPPGTPPFAHCWPTQVADRRVRRAASGGALQPDQGERLADRVAEVAVLADVAEPAGVGRGAGRAAAGAALQGEQAGDAGPVAGPVPKCASGRRPGRQRRRAAWRRRRRRTRRRRRRRCSPGRAPSARRSRGGPRPCRSWPRRARARRRRSARSPGRTARRTSW